MPILTYINNIPLFTTKAEAISYGATASPKMVGYHTHEYESQIGYMAGYFHPTSNLVFQETSYEQYVSQATKSVEVVEQKIENLKDQQNELNTILQDTISINPKDVTEIEDELSSVESSIDFLNSEKDRLNADKQKAQNTSPLKLQDLIDKEELSLQALDEALATVSAIDSVIKEKQKLDKNVVKERIIINRDVIKSRQLTEKSKIEKEKIEVRRDPRRDYRRY